MRAVLTKVKHASVTIAGELKGKIGRGFLILLGVAPDDTEEKCRKMADKLCSLRIFDDENDKINLSLDASVLQKLVDEKQLKYNLVLCGSSQNMMYGLFLDSTAPLYGRADEIMKLAPIRLPYIQEALSLDAMNAIEEYAVWGGVPRYWELRENQNSLNDALWHNILSVNGTLYEEPIKLFQDDVKDIVKTSTIMSYIGTGANRLSEIAARCNNAGFELPFTGGTGFTTYFLLAALMLCMGVYFCKKSTMKKEN